MPWRQMTREVMEGFFSSRPDEQVLRSLGFKSWMFYRVVDETKEMFENQNNSLDVKASQT